MNPWHEEGGFWESAGPLMFTERRRSDAVRDVEEIIQLADLEPSARLLDLCCGVGIHALEFARRGFQVTGVDRTQVYLDEASGRRRPGG